MKRTTHLGCQITYAPFWLVWLSPADGGPERFPHLRVTRPKSAVGAFSQAEPLTEAEALNWWLHSAVNGCTATGEAEDFLALLRDRN